MKVAPLILATVAVAIWTASAAAPARAQGQDFVLHAPFADHAVIQRGQDIAIRGHAHAGAKVSIEFAGMTRTVLTDRQGEWRALFPRQQAATGQAIVARSGGETIAARDIAIGDVFLCSGQSNMQFAMSETALQPKDRKQPGDAALRLLTVPQSQARLPLVTFLKPPAWQTADEAGQDFSAVCFLTGREIAARQKVVVGLIDSSWGGTAIESWTPATGLAAAGGMQPELAILEAFRAAPAAAEARYGAMLDARWNAPSESGGRIGYANLYNAMIAPLADYGLAGALWYQGENNAGRRDGTQVYRAKLTAMLASWRRQFHADLPFVIVQLASFGPLSAMAEDNNWAQVREAQRQVVANDPRTALVVTIDVGERLDIHPPLKLPVARRAAMGLRRLVYGEMVKTGPELGAARLDGSSVFIEIAGASEPLISASWGRPGPFMVCGTKSSQNVCQFADAEFDGERIRVAVPAGVKADTVRYCYAAAPICNVFDSSGLPLGPFSTDLRKSAK
ncbi:sialate O-acetylesterase [Novosphingobium sp. Gsoil 351]|uniref:sialate O-acetylesterase n=1 Tax=Novosphingobium sp. Gsoil 351 TaxID=2675225 RepID=UPI0012B495DA|nr:sialate O-acetylesterase [Novosphingobium sp. Gsoil 351]QGN54145.1 hypothetical protein GKE62_05895 [Novosphingobium sp. Gsoil 351]